MRASKPLAVCQHSGGLPAQSLGQRLVNRAPNLFPLIPQTHSWTAFPHSLAAKRGREDSGNGVWVGEMEPQPCSALQEALCLCLLLFPGYLQMIQKTQA